MADVFDPRTYLAEKKAAPSAAGGGGFDPARYLTEKTGTAPVPSAHVDPMEGASTGEKISAGVGLGMLNTFRSMAELAGHVPGLGAASNSVLKTLPTADPDIAAALLGDPKGVLASFHIPDAIPLVGGQYSITPGKIGNYGGATAASLPAAMIGGGLARLGLAALGASAPVSGLAGLAARALPAIAGGVAQGTVLGGPGNRVLGALFGGGFAGAGSAASEAFGTLARGVVRPTPAASALMGEGVPLSIGQMNPGGFLSKMEEAGQHSALGGETILGARQLPRDVLQLLAAKKSLAPGAELPAGRVRPGDFIEQMHQGFNDAYGGLDSVQMPTHYEGVPVTHAIREAFGAVSSDPSIIADRAAREAVSDFLENQATKLDSARQFTAGTAEPFTPSEFPLNDADRLKLLDRVNAHRDLWLSKTDGTSPGGALALARQASKDAAGPETFTTAEPLLSIRSAIRTALRGRDVAGTSKGQMLKNAEEMVTNALNERLGPEDAAQLAKIDSQYAKLMVLDRAVAASNDSPFGFTPTQLDSAAQSGLGATARARGYGGPLRQLGALGREVLDERSPRTGAIKQTLPLGGNHLAGPLMALMNGPGRDFALGATAPQRAAASLADLLRPRSGLRTFSPSPNALLAPLEVPER